MKIPAIFLAVCLLLCAVSASARSRLVKDLKKGKDRTLVVYGTSISRQDNGPLWVGMIGDVLNRKYKGHVDVLNRGGSGRNSQWGVANFADSVLSAKPDALIIEFSINDAVTRFDISPEESRRNTEWMIDRALAQNPQTEVILLVVASHPVGDVAASRPHLADYIDGYRQLSAVRKLRLIDLSPVWTQLIGVQGEEQMLVYLYDGIHTTRRGALEVIGPKVLEGLERKMQ